MQTVELTFDDWITTDPKLKEKEYFDFNTPPLAIVIAMQNANKEVYEIYSTLTGLGKHPHIKADSVITANDQQKAAEIYDYFSKKHTMRRLKNEHISEYMLAVDELCENRKRIDKDSIKILVTLPRIYEQNVQLEQLLKKYKSGDKNENVHEFSQSVEYVTTIKIQNKNLSENHYFWKTKNNNLVRIRCKTSDISNSAWKSLTKHTSVKFTTHGYQMRVRGYDFFVTEPGGNLEIDVE